MFAPIFLLASSSPLRWFYRDRLGTAQQKESALTKTGARVSFPQAMSTSFHAEGGDTSLWLSSDDLDTIQVRPDKAID